MAAEHFVLAGRSTAGGEVEEEGKKRYDNIKHRAAMFVTPEMIRRISLHLGGEYCCSSTRGGDCSKSSSEDPRRSGR